MAVKEEMTIFDHLDEMRRRLMWSAASIIIAMIASFPFAGRMLAILTEPVGNLVMLRPSEGFFVHLRLALWMGLVIASPVVIYHVLSYVLPALSRRERAYLLGFLPAGMLLFAAGLLFSFYILVPFVYQFFLGFTNEALQPFISIDNYISFVTGLVIPFGVAFELPVLIAVLSFLGIVSPAFLVRNRKFMIFAVFILSAFLTPPDVISQSMLALPLIGLFELSILVSKIIYRRRQN